MRLLIFGALIALCYIFIAVAVYLLLKHSFIAMYGKVCGFFVSAMFSRTMDISREGCYPADIDLHDIQQKNLDCIEHLIAGKLAKIHRLEAECRLLALQRESCKRCGICANRGKV